MFKVMFLIGIIFGVIGVVVLINVVLREDRKK